ncbi:MAG: serine/threonine-protein kinase [Myxococcota bacterium]
MRGTMDGGRTTGGGGTGDSARSLLDWLSLPDGEGIEADAALARLRASMFERSAAPPAIGRYRDLVELGRGGMGVVYRAWDTLLSRTVALKLLRVDRGLDAERLRHEAQAMARLGHDNVVEVFDFGEHRGEAYVAMEFIDGCDLAAWRSRSPRSVAEVLDVFIAAGRGLAAAHAEGLVHRDFKPNNVLVGVDGRVCVADFGLAELRTPTTRPRAQQREESVSEPNGGGGTPRYMAPEQRDGGRVDARTDQWSFAASLRESLVVCTGHSRPETPLHGSLPSLRGAVVRALRRALSTSPAKRFRSMHDLLAALSSSCPRRRGVMAGSAMALAIVGGVAANATPPAPPSQCTLASERIETVWAPQRRAALLASADDAGASAVASVDAWVSRWSDAYAQTCGWSWTAVEDLALRDRTLTCLRGQVTELDGLLQAAQSETARVAQRGAAALSSLPQPKACTGVAAVDHNVPPEALEAHVHSMATIRALERAGRHQRAAAVASDAHAEAGEHRWPAAWAQLKRGRNLMHAGDLDGALEPLEAAYFGGNALGDSELSVQAAIARLELAEWGGDEAQIARWLRHAATWLARWTDAPARLTVPFDLAAAGHAMRQRDWDEARRHLDDAWTGCGSRVDRRCAVHVLSRRGQLEAMVGDFDAAAGSMEDARRSTAIVLGVDHPEMVVALNNLAMVEHQRGNAVKAARLYAEALPMQRAAFGEDHPHTAQLTMNLGVAQLDSGDTDGALASLTRAAALHETHRGNAFVGTADALDNLSAAQIQAERFTAGRDSARRGRAIYEAVLGAEHPKVGLALVHEARACAGVRDWVAAKTLARRGRAVLLQTHAPEHPWVRGADETLAGLDAG